MVYWPLDLVKCINYLSVSFWVTANSEIFINDFSYLIKGFCRMSDSRDKNEEPVMCSKCNVAFQSETEFIIHYDKNHK
jgi:hypothetical protein